MFLDHKWWKRITIRCNNSFMAFDMHFTQVNSLRCLWDIMQMTKEMIGGIKVLQFLALPMFLFLFLFHLNNATSKPFHLYQIIMTTCNLAGDECTEDDFPLIFRQCCVAVQAHNSTARARATATLPSVQHFFQMKSLHVECGAEKWRPFLDLIWPMTMKPVDTRISTWSTLPTTTTEMVKAIALAIKPVWNQVPSALQATTQWVWHLTVLDLVWNVLNMYWAWQNVLKSCRQNVLSRHLNTGLMKPSCMYPPTHQLSSKEIL